MKKVLAIVLALVMCLSLTVISASAETEVKFGLITLHDQDSTYDANFINSCIEACEELGVEYIVRSGIDESNACYEAAVELIEEGCNIIFADSFGHETFLLEAAKEYPEVQFGHATGTYAHTENLDNFHNAFAAIYEGRFLAGIAAGLKLEELKEAGQLKGEVPMMGYVGAYQYAEVISGYTSFYLGAKAVCEDVQMKVMFTSSWYNEMEEKSAAEALIAAGCDLISQHADSMGAPTACENAGIPNIAYNGSTIESCPNTFIVASRINWAPYFKLMINAVKNGETIPTDWCGTFADGAVELTDFNTAAAAEGTELAVALVQAAMEIGDVHVFDCASFTVGGETLTSYIADVDTDPAYTPDTEAIWDGYLHESELRSAPYFNMTIDGIELLNSGF